MNSRTNRTVTIEGKGYPSSLISLYSGDNKLLGESNAGAEDGFYAIKYGFEKEGIFSIKLKQKYKTVESDFTPISEVQVDKTPPAPDLTVLTSIPEKTKLTSLVIEGMTLTGNTVVLNGTEYKVDDNGKFSINYDIPEGHSTIYVKLADDLSNKTGVLFEKTIYKDTFKPSFQGYQYGCSLAYGNSTVEQVCLGIDQFSGPVVGTAYAPFRGYVYGKVKSLKIGNSSIKWNKDGYVSQYVPVYVRPGTNNYTVVIVDELGNKTESTYPLYWTDNTQYYSDYGGDDYSEGSGHDAGYEWAEENGIDDPDDCDGNSDSFIEGCQTYAEEQEDYYDSDDDYDYE